MSTLVYPAKIMMSERAVLPDIGKLDQDPMSQVGYPTGVVGFHGLFGCKPLGLRLDHVDGKIR